MSVDKTSVKTRSQSTIDRIDPVQLAQDVIKDILQNKSFISLVEGSIAKRIKGMEETIEQQNALILELQMSNNDKSRELIDLQKQVNDQRDRLQAMDAKLDAQEQYSRRNCVRVFGCPERQGENTDAIVLKVAKDQLKVDLKLEDIERSHRVGPKRETFNKDSPRGIIVKFKSYRMRQEFISNRRKLKGQRMSIVEDLTARNQKLLNDARTNEKVEQAWSKDGRVFVLLKGTNNHTRLIRNLQDIRKL